MKHPHKIITKEEAVTLFDVRKFDPIGSIRYDTIVVLEGDITLEADLTSSSVKTVIFEGDRQSSEELIIINGNLKVNGQINLGLEEFPALLVLGDLHCDVLHSIDDLIHVTGDAYIKYVFNGNYNHGAITIEGITHVPYVLNSNHSSDINPHKDTILINYYNNNDDFFEYDYYAEDLEGILVEEALSKEELGIDYNAFIDVVSSGKNPIIEGAKTKRELFMEELLEKSDETITTLDLSDKRLKKLPISIFENVNLETLVLRGNKFETLPDEIGNLVNLKTLYLCNTKVKSLPNTIGKLKKLETLNIQFCKNLKSLPESIGNLENLKVLMISVFDIEMPDSFVDLPKLESIEVLNYINAFEEGDVQNFPDWLYKMNGLKHLSFRKKYDKIPNRDILKFKKLNPNTKIKS